MSDPSTAGFEGFYDEWFGRVYNYARHRTGSGTRADEIASETFTRALNSWETYDPKKGERRTWLFSIAFRAIADHYRKEKRLAWIGLDQAPEPSESGPERGVEATLDQRRLFEALAQLSEQAREVVSLKFFSGMTNRDIAALTGLTESNVAVTLFRSVRRMRQDLAPLEQTHE